MSDLHRYLEELRPEVDRALGRFLPTADQAPRRLHEAMRYAVFAGGKRVRPALLIATGELLGAERARLLAGAAALEMIHTFSLIHDDLPALDDDDLRRGRPTLHRRYDEAVAVLAGDALLNLGLSLLATEPRGEAPERRARAVAWLGAAVGTGGMIGGQVADLEAEHEAPENAGEVLEWIHRRKTGALLEVALRLGGLYAGAGDEEDRRLSAIGQGVGLLFQIADDILDCEGETAVLGKTAGKDVEAEKLTYPRVYGLGRSKELLHEVRDRTLAFVTQLPSGGGQLPVLISYLAERDR